jgi:hypothetical protein
MLKYLVSLAVIASVFVTPSAYARGATDSQQSVTAIDIALEPDATMLQHAAALNARLRTNYPKGYSLDATHRPHVSVLQRYVRTSDLPKIYAAVKAFTTEYDMARWKFEAFKIDHAVWSGMAVTVILAKPPQEVVKAQERLIKAIAAFTVATGTAAAFATTPAEPDINEPTIAYVTAFVPKSTGKNYIAHVTCGVASVAFVKQLEAAPFSPFTFSPVGISVYQLGNFGTARKKLAAWNL